MKGVHSRLAVGMRTKEGLLSSRRAELNLASVPIANRSARIVTPVSVDHGVVARQRLPAVAYLAITGACSANIMQIKATMNVKRLLSASCKVNS